MQDWQATCLPSKDQGFEFLQSSCRIRKRVFGALGANFIKSWQLGSSDETMVDKKSQNTETLNQAIATLEEIVSNPSTPKNIKKSIIDLTAELKKGEYSVSMRAANAISLLDDITQDPNMPSYVRVTLWQAVSALERIRE